MVNREKQTAVLKRAQQERKEQKRQKVFQAIQELQKAREPLTFPGIAQTAGVSVSYLYKWPQIKDYIQTLRDDQKFKSHQQPHQEGNHSLKTLHEVARKRIVSLEGELKTVKHENMQLRGYVAEIYELRDECQRLKQKIKDLTTQGTSKNVIPLKPLDSPDQSQQSLRDIPEPFVEAISRLGIKIGVRLQREIQKHDPKQVGLAIAAFEQYRSKTVVSNPGGCLLAMIREGAEPNIPHESVISEPNEFDCWYAEAIRVGFCLDIPKNLLGTVGNEFQVKVLAPEKPGGYRPLAWREAREMMES